ASTFAHLDATTVLSCSTADLAIYPAVDPFRTIKSRMPGPRIVSVSDHASTATFAHSDATT
ncbi:hypothetical protein EDB84DRAFT_1267486, partial [Lactarius hengduanensis]